METMRTSVLWLIRIVVAAFLSSFLHAESVTPCPQQDLPLNQRWNWALKEAQQQHFNKGYWVAYSVDRWMGNREFYITGTRMSFDNVMSSRRPSLSEIFLGKKEIGIQVEESDQGAVKRAAKEALNELDHKQVQEKKQLKGLAILFEFRDGDTSIPSGLAILNMSLSTDLHNRPVLWLGKAADEESLSLMQQLYPSCVDRMKDDLLDGISAHENAGSAFPFLQKIVLSDESDQLRSTAASTIGEIESEQSVSLLLNVCQKDRSKRVREDALDALGDIRLPSAREGVMELAKASSSREIRQQALEMIIEEASPSELEAIKGIILNDPDPEIQETGLYALADRNDSTALLIQVARTHKDHELREDALYALAEDASNDAVVALNQIALNDADEELQEAALYALGDLENGNGIPFVIDIARTHPNKDMRLRAIEVLGDSDDKRSKEALRKLLED